MALQSLMGIPGLGGYLGMEQYRQQQALGNLQGQVGLMNAVRQQQVAEQEAQLAPLRQQMVQAQLGQIQGAVQDAERKRAFFSPDNLKQFMTSGVSAVAPGAGVTGGMDSGATGQIMGVAPAENGAPAASAAKSQRMDLESFVTQGAMQGVFNPEALLNMQTRIQDRIAAREQRMEELKMQLENRAATEAEKRQFQLQLYQLQQQGREDMAKLAASMRQPRQPQLLSTAQGYMSVGPDGKPTLLTGPDGKPVMPASAEKTEKGVSDLRKEFNALPEVKNFRTVVPIIQSIKQAKPTPAGDLDFIYAVGKILDPESVVREGEMNLVIKSGGPMERFKGAVSSVMGGARLTPTIRTNLLQMLNSRVGELRRGYESAEIMYRRNADRRGLPTDEIFMDFGDTSLPEMPTVDRPAGEWSIRKK